MVLRARQRRQEEEFQNIDRQFPLDDFDIAGDRGRRVRREAEDITRPSNDVDALPRLQHLAIFPDLVLALLSAHQRLRVDVLQPDEHGAAPRLGAFLDEARRAVAQLIDLQHQTDIEALGAKRDQAIENRLPILVPGEIIISYEETRDGARVVGAHDRLHVVGAAIARFTALDVDDRAETALERTAASGVEARIVA